MTVPDSPDEAFMRLALQQALIAGQAGEIPVGAVVVKDGQVIGRGHNTSISRSDPTGHAEVVALRNAAQTVGNYRLEDCTLYVTLEPCAMCAGASLHARVARVVYGAADPKAGACGSVVNLFENSHLNHQTKLEYGVLAEACSSQLSAFFGKLRSEKRAQSWPLREDALRTPDAAFVGLPDYPWQPRYCNDLLGLNGLRMHYLDQGPADAPLTYLCLHGNPTWSYLYRKMIPTWTAAGCRVIAPDLIGFGRSDKPKRESTHTFDFHRRYLLEFVEKLDLQHVVLVVQDWGGLLGLTLPMEAAHRYAGLLVMNTFLATGEGVLPPGFLAWNEMCTKSPRYDIARLLQRGNKHLSPQECAAYCAPFPDDGHRAATRAFPALVASNPESSAASTAQAAGSFLKNEWSGKTLMAVGMQDPVFTPELMTKLASEIRGCPEPLLLRDAGHFVQEHGQMIAQVALDTFGGR